MSATPVRGAVLVGGQSRRMGRAKSWIPFEGRSFAARVAGVLGDAAAEACFVGAGELPPDAPALTRLADAPGVAGPLGGILAALRHRPDSAWLVAACDLPLLTIAAARWLLGQRGNSRLAILPRLAPDRIEPLLAVYEPAALELLEKLAQGRERSLQSLALATGVVTPTPPPELATAWRNVNTEEDLRALLPSPSAQPSARRSSS